MARHPVTAFKTKSVGTHFPPKRKGQFAKAHPKSHPVAPPSAFDNPGNKRATALALTAQQGNGFK